MLDWIDRLRDPRIYPDPPEQVEIIQTHLSVVCVAGSLVYKLKKPVQLPFVDFSTAPARHRACLDELQLNRRLCPETYLGVVALRESEGELRFDPVGRAEDLRPRDILEFAVVMRRLPEDRMLDSVLRSGEEIPLSIMDAIAARVADFHGRTAVFPTVGEPGCPTRLHQLALENFAESAGLRGELFDPNLWDTLRQRVRADFPRILPLLRTRLRNGRVVDGHGDLHARNVCLTEPPTLFDCVEFSPDLRCGDTAVENAFLAMDLRYRGRRDLADRYLETYAALTGDTEQARILGPLMQYRAMVRAKVGALASVDPGLSAVDQQGARRSARDHQQLAGAIAAEELGPGMVVACGLPGSGKSFVFEHLAHRAGWEHLSSDRLRKELHPARAVSYTEAAVGKVYDELLDRALERAHATGRPILVDATFRTEADRHKLNEAATASGLWTRFVWFDVPERVALQRIQRRAGSTDSDADAEVFQKLAGAFQAPLVGRPATGDRPTALRLAAERDVDQLVDSILVDLLRNTPVR